MTLGNGMSDGTQSFLMFVAVAIITLNVYLAGVPEIPKWVVILLGAMSAVAVIAKEQFGAKKAVTADRVASN